MKKDFFISYTQTDEQWAKWIAAVLESTKKNDEEYYTCYIQEWDFRPGGNFVLDMNNALIQSERFIAVLSPAYTVSLYCQAEWAAAFTKDPNSEKRLFIPVRVADIEPEGLFAAIVYIDLFGISDEEEAEKRLVNGVDTKNIPRNRPSFPGTPKVRFPGSLPFHNLPYIRNAYFTESGSILKDIHDGFASGNAVSLTQSITGLGGLGKTQTALEYAYRYAYQYDLIWWVSAETEATVLLSYQQFVKRMLGQDSQDSELIVEAVLNWLDTHEKWLFIYDNADGVTGDTPWWPRNIRGNALITTRNRHIYIGKKLDITVFTPEEAVAFLEKRTGLRDASGDALRLAGRLGYLPLALEQAAAYITTNESTFEDYFKLLNDCGLEVLEEMDGVVDYKLPLRATLEISINRIEQEAVKQLLYLCSYLASENIDPDLFCENAELLPSPLGMELAEQLGNKKLWKELTRYSLLEKQDDRKGYSMHRLLQEVVRSYMGNDLVWARCCLSVFVKEYDFEYGNVASHNWFVQLSPHVEAFLQAAVSILTENEEQCQLARLYSEGGFGNNYLGNFREAMDCYWRALAISEKMLGKEHLDTATIYNCIALIYYRQGEYATALDWYQKALIIREKVLGKEHPDTGATYNNIALVYSSQGEYAKALKGFRKALAICEKMLGEEHPDTGAAYNNIAGVYFSQGEYDKALEGYKRALIIGKKVSGEEHPDIAATYNNIALVYYNQKEYTKALECYWQALIIDEKILGKKHPDTATTYNNIAMVYGGKGEYSKALEWYRKVLKISEKVQGKEHPDTAKVYYNIAAVYFHQGDYSKALKWYKKARPIFDKQMGPNHKNTEMVKEIISHIEV